MSEQELFFDCVDVSDEEWVKITCIALYELLEKPYELFVRALINKPRILSCIESILTKHPRVWDHNYHLQNIARGVFTLYYRIFFDLSATTEALLIKQLSTRTTYFAIPNILDLCAIYAPTNTNVLRTLLQQAIKVRPMHPQTPSLCSQVNTNLSVNEACNDILRGIAQVRIDNLIRR